MAYVMRVVMSGVKEHPTRLRHADLRVWKRPQSAGRIEGERRQEHVRHRIRIDPGAPQLLE